VNEPGREDEKDFSEYARARQVPRETGAGGSLLRGCGIALGIAVLLFAFVVGACFIGMR
jgi:hypothetical protein